MGRASDRILRACIVVVRLLTVAAVLALVGGTIYLVAAPASGSPEARATTPRVAGPEAREPPALSPPERGLPAVRTTGTTALVRRLEIGSELNLLREEVGRKGPVAARFEERYGRVAPFLLAGDTAPADWPKDPVSVLLQLTEPRRDVERLVLAGARADDPLGASLRVRAWTLGDPYPADELARVTRTIDHIARRTGRDVRGGIDVLVTPGMGRDVFPFQSELPWAAGVYFREDRYCAVKTRLSRDYRPEVVEHECIHAICGAIPSFSTSRFVTEGLAEYLRLAHPDDPSLAIPRSRFAHELARLALLLDRLEAHGVDVRAIDPRRLVELSPRHFYALRAFSYLVAQATMAYVGGEVIERALGVGSDDAIVAAVRGISWPDFLAFVREGARGGSPAQAMIVEDAAEEAPARRDGATFAGALRAIGAGLPRGDLDPALVGWGDAGDLGTEERIVAVLRAIDQPRNRVCIVTCTFPTEPRCVVPPVPEAITTELLGTPTGETPSAVAWSLATLFQKRHPRNVVARGAQKLRPDALRPFLERREELGISGLVYIVATDCTPALAQLELPADLSGSVLVVDLSADGEAVDLARMHDVPGRLVAYWRLRLAEE